MGIKGEKNVIINQDHIPSNALIEIRMEETIFLFG